MLQHGTTRHEILDHHIIPRSDLQPGLCPNVRIHSLQHICELRLVDDLRWFFPNSSTRLPTLNAWESREKPWKRMKHSSPAKLREMRKQTEIGHTCRRVCTLFYVSGRGAPSPFKSNCRKLCRTSSRPWLPSLIFNGYGGYDARAGAGYCKCVLAYGVAFSEDTNFHSKRLFMAWGSSGWPISRVVAAAPRTKHVK